MGLSPWEIVGGVATGGASLVPKAVGAIGDALTNDFQATPYYVDRTGFTGKNLLLPMSFDFFNKANQAQGQRAPQVAGVAPVGFDMGAADRSRADFDRYNTMLWERANGTGPSPAMENARVQTDAARRQLSSIGASATSRGGISASQAARLATTGAVDAGQRIAGDAGVARQQEMLTAGGLLGQSLATTRQQDIGAESARAGVALQDNQQQLNTQVTNAQLAQQQQQITNQLVQYYTSLGFNAQTAYIMAQQAYDELASRNYNTAEAINSGVAAGNTQTAGNLIGGLLSAGGEIGAKAIGG